MKRLLLCLFLACTPLIAQQTRVTSLMAKPLRDIPGKDVQVLTVAISSGRARPRTSPQRDAFVYVLEGSILMAVDGAAPVTLTAGQMFYEGPNDTHTIGRQLHCSSGVCGVPAQQQRRFCSHSGEVVLAAASVTTVAFHATPAFKPAQL